ELVQRRVERCADRRATGAADRARHRSRRYWRRASRSALGALRPRTRLFFRRTRCELLVALFPPLLTLGRRWLARQALLKRAWRQRNCREYLTALQSQR